MWKFLLQIICAIRFLMSLAFQKAKNYQNLTTESGSNQWFSLLQEKVVIQAVCQRTRTVSIKARYREGYGYLGKVRKFQQAQTNPAVFCFGPHSKCNTLKTLQSVRYEYHIGHDLHSYNSNE